MNISKQQAQDSLIQINNVTSNTRRKIAAGSTGPVLIIWGLVWLIAYAATFSTYFLHWPEYDLNIGHKLTVTFHIGTFIWPVMIFIGAFSTWYISSRKAPTRNKYDKRIGFTWFLLFVYSNVWLVLLTPWNEYQISAFVATLPMFAYIVMGLWIDRLLLWLGLAVTALIITGFFIFHFQPLFWLWMAVLGGGALILTGLYVKLMWSK